MKVHKYVQAFIVQVERLLEGSIVGDPDLYGQTLREEKETCGSDLNLISFSLPPPHFIYRNSTVA